MMASLAGVRKSGTRNSGESPNPDVRIIYEGGANLLRALQKTGMNCQNLKIQGAEKRISLVGTIYSDSKSVRVDP